MLVVCGGESNGSASLNLLININMCENTILFKWISENMLLIGLYWLLEVAGNSEEP